MYIHIWACHGGTANKDVEILNPGSIIVTHIESKYIALNITEDFSLLTSITRYMREDNLSPHLQYLYDQLENYQATTFNQIEDNGHIMKFKSIRNLEPDSSANIILNSLQQKNISEELIKKLQNYQALEAKRFHEVLKDYVSFTDIEQFQNHISNISEPVLKRYKK
ncbi:hypothetical protein [Rickettsia endosymbiont of Pantilius tunicatus]|uniref:hypothetical protein n=1 Tax=Rickettsia endosymbiont of Pantilius tunicatus TaxID=3066267 RepID=UPI00376EC4CA